MKKKVGLHPLATLGLAVALTGSVYAATLVFSSGFSGTDLADKFAPTTAVLRAYTSVPSGQSSPAVEIDPTDTLTTKPFPLGSSSSKVIAISCRVSRSPELNDNPLTTSVVEPNEAIIQVLSSSSGNLNRHVAYIVHSQAKYGTVADDGTPGGLKWRAFSFLIRVNGGNNTVTFKGIAPSSTLAGKGILLDNVAVQVVSN